MAVTIQQVRSLAVGAVVCVLTGCTGLHQQDVGPPGDGVHITGAISAVYPITDGGTCPFLDMGNSKQLEISANPGPGQAYFGAVVANFTGPGTYTDVQWPPDGHSSLYAALGARNWRANGGSISVTAFGNGAASGTLSAKNLVEVNGSTTVDASGSWTCRILLPAPMPSPSPPPSPLASPSPSPAPVGVPETRRILPPATALPVVDLCSAPVQTFQDGNAGPLFCLDGALNSGAWLFFAQLNPLVMTLGPYATLVDIKPALCFDTGQGHITLLQEDSAYALTAAYYGWAHGFDPSAFMIAGGCP
jgi:hypothetical protein